MILLIIKLHQTLDLKSVIGLNLIPVEHSERSSQTKKQRAVVSFLVQKKSQNKST